MTCYFSLGKGKRDNCDIGVMCDWLIIINIT